MKMNNDMLFESIHEHYTSDHNKAQAFQRLTQTQRSLSFAGPRIWNALFPYIRTLDNINTFKK